MKAYLTIPFLVVSHLPSFKQKSTAKYLKM